MKPGCTCRRPGEPCLVPGVHTVSKKRGEWVFSNGVRIYRLQTLGFKGKNGFRFKSQIWWDVRWPTGRRRTYMRLVDALAATRGVRGEVAHAR